MTTIAGKAQRKMTMHMDIMEVHKTTIIILAADSTDIVIRNLRYSALRRPLWSLINSSVSFYRHTNISFKTRLLRPLAYFIITIMAAVFEFR